MPEPAAGELERFLEALKPPARLRWVTRAQFHITLRFLGEQTRETIEQVKKALAPIRFAPFGMELSYAGAFPNMKRPRVLWLSGKKGKGALNNYIQKLPLGEVSMFKSSLLRRLTLLSPKHYSKWNI